MAKKQDPIEKKNFSFDAIKAKFSREVEYKETRYLDCGPVFMEACGLPGPLVGHINIFLGHSDSGKAQPLTSNVLTPEGWVKMGDIKVGDKLIDSAGSTQEVLGIFPQGQRPVYKVSFSDGAVVFCDEDHLWSVNEYKRRHKGKKDENGVKRYDPDYSFHTMKTIDMLEKVKTSKQGKYYNNNYLIPTLKPVRFVEESDLKVDPYVMGCVLGDGHLSGDIVQISTKDEELIEFIKATPHFRYDKFIPSDYIFKATVEDRLNLLKGLMDTGGYCDRLGCAEFTTVSEKLKDGVVELVQSLGGICRVRSKVPTYTYKGEKRKGRRSYTVSVRIPPQFNPFRLSRKSEGMNEKRVEIKRYISDISYSHQEECQCILVSSPDHLYVTDGYVLTHNTTALIKTAIAAQKMGMIPVFVITEQKWDFSHAAIMGFDVDSNYLFNNSLETLEEVGEYINNLLDGQAKGEIPYDLVFLWDSIGSVPCELTKSGKGSAMANALLLNNMIGMNLNQRIHNTRKVTSPYTSTLVIVNQPWVETDMTNPMAQPKIRAKGGMAAWLNASLVFLFGNEKNSGTSRLRAVKNKRDVVFGIRSRISVLKNHINGVGTVGKVIITPHDFISDDDKAIKEYKDKYNGYWMEQLGSGESTEDGDFSLEEEGAIGKLKRKPSGSAAEE